ncbi:uncharacterized protein VTP21DRAFT_3369 [Calcarisporiella thermophila]|uniref:uncharacterized protein n=1 Tax=Calcarisporiella thermophila TaxID=911321 RepID=UPI0037429961
MESSHPLFLASSTHPNLTVAILVFLCVCVGFLVFSFGFTKYYQNQREAELLVTIVTIVGLTLTFATVALFPIDIFLVSSTVDPRTGLKKGWATPNVIANLTFTLKAVYYIAYGAIAFFCFFLVPFAYFYFEELEESQTVRQRTMSSIKYTTFFIVIVVVLFVTGMFLHPSTQPSHIDLDWFKHLLDQNGGEKALVFVIAVLIFVGLIVYIAYTAPGLTVLPMTMIKDGFRNFQREDEEIAAKLAINREKQRAITVKYLGTDQPLSSRDRKQLENLEREERILIRRSRNLEESQTGILNRIFAFFRPLKSIFGVLFLALSLLFAISIIITSLDKIKNSICGSRCGFLLTQTKIPNPLNLLFLRLSSLFPLDSILLGFVVLYIFVCTLVGIIHIGVRFAWVDLFRIRRNSTPPQGLLLLTFLLMLTLLALNYTLVTVVMPGYGHFGGQYYCNHTQSGTEVRGVRDCSSYPQLIVPCDVYGPSDICTPTVVSTFINRISVNTPFFGMAFYYMQWIFLAVFFIAFAVVMVVSPRVMSDLEVEQEVEQEEEAALLEAARGRVHDEDEG